MKDFYNKSYAGAILKEYPSSLFWKCGKEIGKKATICPHYGCGAWQSPTKKNKKTLNTYPHPQGETP